MKLSLSLTYLNSVGIISEARFPTVPESSHNPPEGEREPRCQGKIYHICSDSSLINCHKRSNNPTLPSCHLEKQRLKVQDVSCVHWTHLVDWGPSVGPVHTWAHHWFPVVCLALRSNAGKHIGITWGLDCTQSDPTRSVQSDCLRISEILNPHPLWHHALLSNTS